MSDNPDRNMKNENIFSQLTTYSNKMLEKLEQDDFQTVLRAAGETETTQENIRDWLKLDEALDRGKNCCSDIFLFIFTSNAYVIVMI
jgi:hypothetical protein